MSYGFNLLHGCDFLALFQVRYVLGVTCPHEAIDVDELVVAVETSNLLHFVDVPRE